MILRLTACVSLFLLKVCVGLDLEDKPASTSADAKIPTIEVKGNKFFETGSGYQFFIKGIAYQKRRGSDEIYDRTLETFYIDSMANPKTCLRDLENFKELGINVVRVYQIDPNANHDICMNEYAKSGIYILADLSEPELSINRDKPSWDVELFERYASVIDSMHSYRNVLGFFAGNEVTNSKVNTDASPFVKAAVRDVKDYIQSKGYRNIPVGYASNDDAEIRKLLFNYLTCTDEKQPNSSNNNGVDFLGLNMYEWCGYSSYITSGYRERTMEFSDFGVPIFFSEYGCNTVSPRPFTEVEALYGSTMSKVWSGGIAYEYFDSVNRYGIVTEDKDGGIHKSEDYEILKQRLNSIELFKIHKLQIEKGIPSPNCTDSDLESLWKASKEIPPRPDVGKCECLQSTLSCVVSPFQDMKHEQEFLNRVCSSIDCHEIEADGSLGFYGRFSDCSTKQKISFALNKNYIHHHRKSEFCDFDGQAVLITNSDKLDLKNIFARDGRTCQDAIGEGSDESDKKYEQYVNKKGNNGTMHYHSPIQRTNEKEMKKQSKSGGEKLTTGLIQYLILMISFIYNFH